MSWLWEEDEEEIDPLEEWCGKVLIKIGKFTVETVKDAVVVAVSAQLCRMATDVVNDIFNTNRVGNGEAGSSSSEDIIRNNIHMSNEELLNWINKGQK